MAAKIDLTPLEQDVLASLPATVKELVKVLRKDSWTVSLEVVGDAVGYLGRMGLAKWDKKQEIWKRLEEER